MGHYDMSKGVWPRQNKRIIVRTIITHNW